MHLCWRGDLLEERLVTEEGFLPSDAFSAPDMASDYLAEALPKQAG